MPFCIIFLCLVVIYIICFEKMSLDKVINIVLSLGFVASLFFATTSLGDCRINFVFIILLFVLLMYTSIQVNYKTILVYFCVSIILSIIYLLAINYNIFLSIDYSYRFALCIYILPILFNNLSTKSNLLLISIELVYIMVCEYLLWMSQLQFVEFNYVNLLNMATILLAVVIAKQIAVKNLRRYRNEASYKN